MNATTLQSQVATFPSEQICEFCVFMLEIVVVPVLVLYSSTHIEYSNSSLLVRQHCSTKENGFAYIVDEYDI